MTSYEQVRDWFYAIIERDWEFFNYYGIQPAEAVQIAEKRADNYMEEAVRLVKTKCLPQIDFSKRTENNDGFDFDFTPQEELLIPMIMFERYLHRDIAKLALENVNFTSSEIKVFDPSNARKTFLEMYMTVTAEVDQLIDDYKNTDRKTGEYRAFDPSLYDTAD